jgi:hypothetical protein
MTYLVMQDKRKMQVSLCHSEHGMPKEQGSRIGQWVTANTVAMDCYLWKGTPDTGTPGTPTLGSSLPLTLLLQVALPPMQPSWEPGAKTWSSLKPEVGPPRIRALIHADWDHTATLAVNDKDRVSDWWCSGRWHGGGGCDNRLQGSGAGILDGMYRCG